MQTLLADLFPWIAAFALADGVAQLGRGHVLLATGWRRFTVRRAGLHLLPLGPFAEAVAAHDLPFLAGASRAWFPDPRRRAELAVFEASDLEPVPLDGLEVAREGRKVVAGARLLAVAPTPAWAERAREDLAWLAAQGASRAAAWAARCEARSDLAAARALRARQRPWLAALRALAAAAFALVFLAWPLAAYAPSLAPLPAGWLLSALGALIAGEALLVLGMLRACGESPGAASAAALHLLALPVSAVHPLLHAGRSLYRRFDAPTVAAALLEGRSFRALAARELRRARFSRAATDAELASEWSRRERRLEALIVATGGSVEDALAPAPAPGAAGWCPLCAASFLEGPERCIDCGVPLERVA
jgi:hypothetical protein